ncbi:MAG: YaaC family protein [Acidimicrobiia bacterium]
MAGRPPNARQGTEASLAGRRIGAGLAPFRREISPRASTAELWATIETAISEPYGFERLEKLHRAKLDKWARLRARAYLNQARQYHNALEGLAPVAKPLLGYYFALNLTKVFLTVVQPDLTKSSIMLHGLGQAYERGSRYSFKRERFKIASKGAFPLLAKHTGMKYCWPKDYTIGLSELLPYLPDAHDLFADSNDEAPRLLPVVATRALFGKQREAWLRVEVEEHVLRQRNLRPERLLNVARIFGDRFRLVTTAERTYSFESKDSFKYGKMRSEVIPALCNLYDDTLIASDRSFAGPRQFIALSDRPQLLSHEAIAFAVLHHLSNIVRYRPADAERILTTRNAWLLTTWVDRGCENLLLNLSTRITGQDHVVV